MAEAEQVGDLLVNSRLGAVKRRTKTTTETQRIAELGKGGEYKISLLLIFSVFSVPLW